MRRTCLRTIASAADAWANTLVYSLDRSHPDYFNVRAAATYLWRESQKLIGNGHAVTIATHREP